MKEVKKVVVASTNPVKVNAARYGFEQMFPGEEFEFEGIPTSSGVSDQPKNSEEIFNGAKNRVQAAAQAVPAADFWVGIESGIEGNNELEAFAWVVVRSKDGKVGRARTGSFLLPPAIAKLIHEGKELGEADDIVFGRENSKQKNGAVGFLTGDATNRTKYYTDAVVLALIPFKNRKYYS